METDVKWWELNTDISPNVSLPLGHDGVLTSHPCQGTWKKPFRCAGGIRGPNSLFSSSQKLKADDDSENQNLLMNLFIPDAHKEKVLSEQLTLKITTESSDCRNWSDRPTSKAVKLRPRAWNRLVQGYLVNTWGSLPPR